MFSGCDSGAADLEGPRRRLWVLSHFSVTGPCHSLVPAGCWPCPWSSGPGEGEDKQAQKWCRSSEEGVDTGVWGRERPVSEVAAQPEIQIRRCWLLTPR